MLIVGVVGCGGGHAGSDGGAADGRVGASDGGDAADVPDAPADVAVDRSDAGATGRDGADVADTGADAATSDAAPPCTPCNLALGALIASCSEGTSGVSCVVQTSQTANSDGTTVNVVNQCFAGGAKLLTSRISGGVDAGAFVSSTSQRIKDGLTCLTQQTSGVRSSAGLVATDLFLDGVGRIVATVMTNALTGADGGVVQIQTMACPGQPSEPYRVCLPAAPLVDAGAGDAGGLGTVNCTPGTCP